MLTTPDGSTVEQWADEEGLTHRIDAPAEIEYDPLGGLSSERWYERGAPHRRGAPAMTIYRPRGEVAYERWYADGSLHRLEGPAVLSYDRDGAMSSAGSWHFRGIEAKTAESFIAKIVSTYPEHVIREELTHTPYAEIMANGAEPSRILEAIGAGITTAEGVTEYLGGAPAEWVRSYESAR